MQYLPNRLASACNARKSRRARSRLTKRLRFERLEERALLAGVFPNDPEFAQQWTLHNTGQITGGLFDADMDLPAAWSIATGSMNTVVAVLDSGVDYTDPDLYLNIWLNESEIPTSLANSLTDVDNDAIITFRDLNAAANSAFVSDVNTNGYIDGGDLLHDARWADGLDEDNNGRPDDLVGWDFHANDNDPQPEISDGVYQSHGTEMAKIIGAMTDNGLGKAGINWDVRLLPVRIRSRGGDTTDIVNANAAAGVDYAVESGAPISNNSWRAANGGYVYSQEIYDAISRARDAGHIFVAAPGNHGTDNDITPFFPASYDLDNIIASTGTGASDRIGDLAGPLNYGHTTVDMAASTPGGTSGSSATTAGVAALLKSLNPDLNYLQLKSRLMSTIDILPSLTGKTVTGGRVNAAQALAATSISISDPIVAEGSSGTGQVAFTITRTGDNSGSVTVNWSTSNGSATAGSDYVGASGQVTFQPLGSNSQTIYVTVAGDLTREANETFFVDLSLNSSAGPTLLADDRAQVTILDYAKFYVANDGSSDRTYEYASTGTAIENYVLNTGNTAPRGAASYIVGDRVWIVDANQRVYVYTNGGSLLGSWGAYDLPWNAAVEGVATDGTDIWLVDAKTDKVYRYDLAAGRIMGFQYVADSFLLNSGNSNPKDIVTDGTYLYVVNDAASDKVFKYTLAGSLVASWTISTSGAKNPTGITLDPSNPSSLWIVDSGTDRVYEYRNAINQSNGSSKSADASFALASGNTNPQGIADPPPLSEPASYGEHADSSSTAAATCDFALEQFLNRSPVRSGERLASPTREHAARSPERWLTIDFGAAITPANSSPTTIARRVMTKRAEVALDQVFAEWDGNELHAWSLPE